MDSGPEQVLGRPPPLSRPPVLDISIWVERYSTMAALLATRFPHKATELFAYLAMIVRAERNYEAGRWVAYDRQFRREALARKDLNWSAPDPRLFSEAFTGRAKSIPRCSLCLQDDHLAQACPQNPDRQWMAWAPGPSPSAVASPAAAGGKRPDVCRNYNRGICRRGHGCRYDHLCLECGTRHGGDACQPRAQGSQGPYPTRRPAGPPPTRNNWTPGRR